MLKIIPPQSWDFGVEPLVLLKQASTGLHGVDLSAFIKRAGHELADWVKRALVPAGETWAHAIAMGSDEGYGHNRNTDYWDELNLKKDHHTFEKLARCYRNHNNTDPEKSYGMIRKSWYNPDMRRVELILGYNGTKEAAERNRGRIADLELDDLEANKPFGGSMSVKIAYDICDICGNKSANRSQYCDEHNCPAGGMSKHAGRVLEDGRIVRVANIGNRFFDYSRVPRNADRTAYVLGKVASHGIVTGAELAEQLGLVMPDYLLDIPANILGHVKLARELSAQAAHCQETDCILDTAVPTDLIEIPEEEKPLALKALAQCKIALDLSAWLEFVAGSGAAKVAQEVQAAWRLHCPHFADREDLCTLLREAAFPEQAVPQHMKNWAQKNAAYSLDEEKLRRRLWQSTLRNTAATTKYAGAISKAAEELAVRYTAYQTAFLEETGKFSDSSLTIPLLIRQNEYS